MAQGIQIKGKTSQGQSVDIHVDDNGDLQFVVSGVEIDATGLATEAKQDLLIDAIEGISIDIPEGGATLAEQEAQTALLGALTETAPASDTASSGLNGRLQRIAQRLTSLIALLPGSLGQKARAASLAVTLSSEDVTALTPPAAITGFATQTTLAALLTELQLKADLSETQPVSAASLPLPTGAATSAKQDTGNNSLDSIDTKLPAQGQALAAASTPVVLPAAQITTLTPPAAITGFATSAKQDTLLAELQLKADLTETQPVSAASLPLPTGAATSAKQDTIIGHVDGVETAIASTNTKLDTVIGHVDGLEALIGTTNTNTGAAATALQIMDDWDESDRAKVNPIAGQAGVAANAGTVGATTQRVVKGTGTTSNQTQVADSASSQTILASNTGRIRATIVNDSTQVLYLRESSSAATTSNYTWKVQPDGTVVIDDYNGALTGIWAANASGQAVVSEVVA